MPVNGISLWKYPQRLEPRKTIVGNMTFMLMVVMGVLRWQKVACFLNGSKSALGDFLIVF